MISGNAAAARVYFRPSTRPDCGFTTGCRGQHAPPGVWAGRARRSECACPGGHL